MRITGVQGVSNDYEFIFVVLVRRNIFWMVEDRAYWINHGGGQIENLNGNVMFGNIDSGIERTEGGIQGGRIS